MKVFVALLCIFAVSLQFVPSAKAQGVLINWTSLTAAIDEYQGRFSAIDDVFFILYTNEKPGGEIIDWQNSTFPLNETTFDSGNPTRILIHGWTDNSASPSEVLVKNAYLQKGDFNVIHVDWYAGGGTQNYIDAKNRVGVVGVVVGDFIKYLAIEAGISREDVYIVGHSLGAHVAGFAGKHVKSDGNGKVAAIVGLDPAEPFFTGAVSAARLDKTDATNVQVIKTSALGYLTPIGTSYFTPNIGTTQPGCNGDIVCNHNRAFHYFARSINAPKLATKCTSWGMAETSCSIYSTTNAYFGGEPLDASASGYYAVTTNAAAPFW